MMFRFTDVALWPFNQVINTALRLDRESQEKLVSLSGKMLAIEWKALSTTVYVYLQADSIKLSFSTSQEPDALVSSDTPLPMLKLIANPNASSVGGDISVQGDVHVVQQLQQIFSHLSIDWEEHLAGFIGDGASHQVGKATQDFRHWSKDVRENMQLNTTEFLQQETQSLPSRAEVEDFLKEVDHLRNDIERTAVRIKHLINERETL